MNSQLNQKGYTMNEREDNLKQEELEQLQGDPAEEPGTVAGWMLFAVNRRLQIIFLLTLFDSGACWKYRQVRTDDNGKAQKQDNRTT